MPEEAQRAITDFWESDVQAWLSKQSEESLHNLSITGDFGLPPTLHNLDVARVPDLGIVRTTPTSSSPPGVAPGSAGRRFSAGQSSGLTQDERREVAQWMAREAESRGLPPELPVMAALTETGDTLRNLVNGDRDSVGFFQIRVSIHGSAAVATPEAQLAWFLSTAARSPLGRTARQNGWSADLFKEKIAAARGAGNTGELSLWLGRWCQDVERSAFPDRYEQRYGLARKLINGT